MDKDVNKYIIDLEWEWDEEYNMYVAQGFRSDEEYRVGEITGSDDDKKNYAWELVDTRIENSIYNNMASKAKNHSFKSLDEAKKAANRYHKECIEEWLDSSAIEIGNEDVDSEPPVPPTKW